MQSGTAFAAVKPRSSWPPGDVTSVTLHRSNESCVLVSFWPDGRVGVRIEDDKGEEHASYFSQPIEIIGAGVLFILVEWEDGEVRLQINEEPVKSWVHAPLDTLIVTTIAAPFDSESAFARTDARTICKSMMEHRARHYAIAETKTGRRALTIDDDIDSLQTALRAMGDIVDTVEGGNSDHLPTLRGMLRQLIVEELHGNGKRAGTPKSNYRPLLLRVAARLDAELPVYGKTISRSDIPEFLLAQDAQMFTLHPFGIYKTSATQSLMDLQDLLRLPAYFSPLPNEFPDGYTINDLVSKAAATMGGAHYDPSVPMELENLSRLSIGEDGILSGVFLELAKVVIALGSHIISKR